MLAPFDFEILYKKGIDNSLPDFLTREYLIKWFSFAAWWGHLGPLPLIEERGEDEEEGRTLMS